MTRVMIQALGLLLLGCAIGWWISPGRGLDTGVSDGSDTLPACQYEDGPGPCYWDAQVRGNGTGRSFTMDADEEVTYR